MPGPPEDCRQQQIDRRARGQSQGLPAAPGERCPDHGPAGVELQRRHRDLKGHKGRQMARLMEDRGQEKGQRQAPAPQQPEAARQEKEARCYRDSQKASPKQPMRQGNAKCRMQNAESVDRPKFMLHFAFCILHCVCNRVCKPGSVLDSHLSCRTVADTLCATSSETAGPANVSSTVLLRIEFTASDSLQPTGELLPHLSTLAPLVRGGISLLHFS